MATDVASIRTIVIAGQSGVGKTSVADALVFAAGGNNRLGRVDDESSLFDTEPEEIRRRSTITCSLHGLSWDKHDMTVIDSPGQGNFVLDTMFCLRGVGGMVLIIDPLSPLQAETMKVWKWAKEEGVPTIAVLNRMDRPEIDVDAGDRCRRLSFADQ